MRPEPHREARLAFIFLFVMLYPGILTLVRPVSNQGQVALRIGMFLVGAIGLVVVSLRRWRRPRE